MLNAFETLVVVASGAALAWGFCLHLNWCMERLGRVRSPFGFWGLHGLMRMGGVLAGFYIAGNGDASRMVLCLAGFVVMRIWLIHHATQAAPAASQSK